MRAREALRLQPGEFVWVKRQYRDPYERRQPVELEVERVVRGDNGSVFIWVKERPGVAFRHTDLEIHRFHIVRFEFPNFTKPAYVFAANVTLREAREHCSRPDTHSTEGKGIRDLGPGDWFDGYTEATR